MSARLRSSLHPLTVASIDMQNDCSCGPFGKPPHLWLCEYHQGFQDGIDQLLDQQEVKSETGSHLSAAFSSFYSVAADEIVRLRADYADMVDRADRAEADADRLAEAITASDGRGRAYAIREALLAHDREVEAR